MSSFQRRLQQASLGSAMADLAMLLLIFFMTTTTTDPPKTIEINLPKASTSGLEGELFYIALDNKGDIYFEDEKITLDKLTSILEEKSPSKEKRINILADSTLKFSRIDQVLQELRQREFLNVAFMAQSFRANGSDRKLKGSSLKEGSNQMDGDI